MMPTICSLPSAWRFSVALCHPGTCTRQPAHQEAKMCRRTFCPLNCESEIGRPSASDGRIRSGKGFPISNPGLGKGFAVPAQTDVLAHAKPTRQTNALVFVPTLPSTLHLLFFHTHLRRCIVFIRSVVFLPTTPSPQPIRLALIPDCRVAGRFGSQKLEVRMQNDRGASPLRVSSDS